MENLTRFFQEQSAAISNAEYLPSYKKVQMAILAGVQQGIWKEGSLLPPERKLAEICGMSVGTIKRAMLELVHQGWLYRRQGSGTYVSGASFTRQHRRYYLLLKDFHEKESPNAVKLLRVNRIKGMPAANKALGLEAEEELFEIVRVFHEEERKCVLSYSYLPVSRFAGLDMICRKRLENVPLYIVLEEDYKTQIVKTEELFSSILADSNKANILDINENTPLLKIEALSYTMNEIQFEYRISYCITGEKKIYRII
ncbi:GntR family transcriptional regulator [Desulfovibrio sp. SGI.169]|uniref:GntR family transcriptional regulator n=1 Tax=Desulfovibrio sp. SGI.169 TaxID=3420561 RepID=UPI003CFBFC28